MQKNVVSQKWRVFAFDANGAPVTGEAANITGKVALDHGTRNAITDTNPAETEDGYYLFDLTQGETNGDEVHIYPECSTAEVYVVGDPGSHVTVPPNFTDFAIESDGKLTELETMKGGTWNGSTDTLENIRDAIAESAPQSHSATVDNLTTGTLDAGGFAATATADASYWQTSPAGAAVGGFGLNQDLTFSIGIGRVADFVEVTGYFNSGALRTVQVWGYDYNLADWVQLSNSTNDFGNTGSNQIFQYATTANMRQASDGEVKIRFTSTSTNTGDDFFVDAVVVGSINQGAAGLTADSIQSAVWARLDSGHDENTLGYNLSKAHLLHGDIVSATSASQFIIDQTVTANDSLNGMIIMLEDKTDDHYEVRRIVDSVAGTNEIFVDAPFGFTPVANDDFYVLSSGYANVNVTHSAGTAQTANDNGADINTLVAQVGTAGAGLTDLGGMSTGMKSEINAEADQALAAYNGPTNAEMEARTLVAADYFDPAADTVANVTLVATTTNVTNEVSADVAKISGDATAADNAELAFDGTGYGFANCVIPTVTTLNGHTVQTGDTYALAAGASGFAAIDTVVDSIKVVTDALTSAAAAKLALSTLTITVGAATSTVLTNIAMSTNLTETTDDHYNGQVLKWTSGILLGQGALITDYNGTTKVLTFTALANSETPADGDAFIIL